MGKNPKLERMLYLIENLNRHTELYEKGIPEISDAQWDQLYFELFKLEKIYGAQPNSPTQKIHYTPIEKLSKKKHTHPMLSLEKTKESNDVMAFVKGRDYVLSAKLDGLSCTLRYENGALVSAETRGDGEEGEDVTHNAMVINNIPKRILTSEPVVEIDGEVICTKTNFESFAHEYKNPRNFAAGSLRLLNPKECAKRKLSFIGWSLITPKVERFSKGLELMARFGFDVVPYLIGWDREFVKDNMLAIKETAEDIKKFPIDGLVFRYDDTEYGESLGMTAHHPKHSLAFKFTEDAFVSTLRKIDWTMGRGGRLAPVAVFDGIDIGGTWVTRASLHHINIMKDLGVKAIGQNVKVIKANEIIPQIVETGPVTKKMELIEIPKTCPFCGCALAHELSNSGTEDVICKNPTCGEKLVNKIEHFTSKRGLNMKGLSIVRLNKLINAGLVSTIEDLFLLKDKKSELLKISGFGEKMVSNILQSIEESRTTTFAQFLSALGIPLIGESVSKELAKYFETYQDFRHAIVSGMDLSTLPRFGSEKHNQIVNYDYEIADRIANKYLNFINKQVTIEHFNNELISGKSFVITGKMKTYKNRKELVDAIEGAGGKVLEKITSKVSYLINNDKESQTTKNRDAHKLGIPIINEEEIKKMLDN